MLLPLLALLNSDDLWRIPAQFGFVLLRRRITELLFSAVREIEAYAPPGNNADTDSKTGLGGEVLVSSVGMNGEKNACVIARGGLT